MQPDEESLALIGLFLGLMTFTLTMMCTWMTNRKRRVGSHMTTKHGCLILEAPPSRGQRCHTISTTLRYSTKNELSINPITHPSIIVTPPTPLAMMSNSPFLRSDSSIGSAADLLEDPNDQPSENRNSDAAFDSDFCADSLEEEKDRKERDNFMEVKIKDIAGNTSNEIHTADPKTLHDKENIEIQTNLSNSNNSLVYSVSMVKAQEMTSAAGSEKVSGAVVISINNTSGNGYRAGDIIDTDVQFDSTPCSPRPRLCSIEPGSRKPNINVCLEQKNS